MSRWVALLRGINVGGNNLIKMQDLKACFEENGFSDVATYIQSGNVLFSSTGGARAKLAQRVERMLSQTFGYAASVVLRDRAQMQKIVSKAPKGFGSEPTKYRYDVAFLKESLTAAAALEEVPIAPGVDRAHAGTGVLYFSRLAAKATQSKINRVASLPIYRNMTLRNWNTTTKLLELMST
jgi:uncharacterized protein (DUF1697 family)